MIKLSQCCLFKASNLATILAVALSTHLSALEGKWGNDRGYHSWVFEFKADGKFELGIHGMGPQASLTGQYRVNGDRIVFSKHKVLFASYVDQSTDTIISLAEIEKQVLKSECRIGKFSSSLKYSEGISCKKINSIFWNYSSSGVSGLATRLKDINIVTTGTKKAKTAECVRMREKPSQNARIVRYIPAIDEGKSFECVPKDIQIVIYARTPSKEKINSWENYWYLADIRGHELVWVYGEFIRFE